MMGRDAPDDRGGGPGRPGGRRRQDSIELEPVTREDTPRYVADEDGQVWVGEREPSGPVPRRPVHVCPTCDYNLTGLTSRRCPECGEPFTMSEARRRGVETSPFMRRLYRAARIERFGGAIGLLLLLASFVVPNAVDGGFSNWPQVALTKRGLLMLLLLMVVSMVTCLGKAMMDVVWPRALLVAGLVAMLLGLAVAVL